MKTAAGHIALLVFAVLTATLLSFLLVALLENHLAGLLILMMSPN